jgi:hypothetical protein
VASTAPAVPGPQGQKPAPKPVPMMTGNSGGVLIADGNRSGRCGYFGKLSNTDVILSNTDVILSNTDGILMNTDVILMNTDVILTLPPVFQSEQAEQSHLFLVPSSKTKRISRIERKVY